jgi:hypothetical protein
VRLAGEGSRVVVDHSRHHPGRGAYIHTRCVTTLSRGQIARTLKRAVNDGDVKRIVFELSLSSDNSGDRTIRNGGPFSLGVEGAKPVETAPRITAKE